MEQVLMLWMGIFWDIALLRLTLRTVRRAGERNESVQFSALTFGMGSALGVAFCALSGLTAPMIAFALGFMLSYAAFVFTLPEKRKAHEAL